MALVMAHVDLAKAEAGAIAGQVGRVVALGALAFALVVFAVFLLVIGVSLFLGEWVFGSMAWGVVHGVLAFASIAMVAVLVAVGVTGVRIVRSLALGIIVAILVGVVLWLNLPNQLYTAIGNATGLAVDPGIRPLVVGLILGATIGLLIGILVASSMNASGGGRAMAIVGVVVLGTLVGAFTAITFSPQVAAAIAVTVAYVAWMAFMGADVARTGIDVEALKNRFYPVQTVETSKETLEWLQKRMPPGFGS